MNEMKLVEKLYQKNQKIQKNKFIFVKTLKMSCNTENGNTCGEQYELEAVVSFDERGQLVLPKDVRKKFNLKVGEKLALISCMTSEGVCCFTLVRTKNMQSILKQTIPF